MNATTVIGYAYDADMYCIDDTIQDLEEGIIKDTTTYGTLLDRSGIPYGATGQEGNPVYPVFATDSFDYPPTCGRCYTPLMD